ncbi:uncharacterized protein TM35_000084280 [Trypanosoma theileri]|uniref:Uncharacterized protein n=1 Tax=Trypanosoma theileri TaxID=67003 RepID=A0A1X0P2L1_9TRYP|nr:uncharacterized protein TM35_000084280 [Trypanosoma theileri]ORC90630.1 hypothetical protein TM35_000084280 [Trypanosoma theileri]
MGTYCHYKRSIPFSCFTLLLLLLSLFVWSISAVLVILFFLFLLLFPLFHTASIRPVTSSDENNKKSDTTNNDNDRPMLTNPTAAAIVGCLCLKLLQDMQLCPILFLFFFFYSNVYCCGAT